MEYRWDEREAAARADDLDRMVYLSRQIGADPLLAQSGGGNTSIKWTEKDPAGRPIEALRIKSSGIDMAGMGRGDFTGLRLDGLRVLRDRDAMTDEELLALLDACRLDPREAPPSLETALHALLPGRCIAHVHDLATLALTNTSRRNALVSEALGEEAIYVGYVRPGFPLARTVRALGDPGPARGLVMGKHGLAAWGRTPKECYDNLHSLVSRAEAYIQARRAGPPPFAKRRHPEPGTGERRARAAEILPVIRGILSRERRILLRFDGSDEAAAFASSQRAKDTYRRGMATPEHIFRCGRMPLYVDAPLGALPAPDASKAVREAIEEFERAYRTSYALHGRGSAMHDPLPRVLILPGLGIAASGKSARDAETARLYYRHVVRVIELAESLDQFRFLEEASSFELEYWPWHRSRPPLPEGELARRAALVAGADPGLGRAVAERLRRAGAEVTGGDGALKPDEAVRKAVLAHGGIDILVCGPEAEDGILETAARAMGSQGSGMIILAAPEPGAGPALSRRTRDLADGLAPRGIRVTGLHAGAPGAAAEAVLFLASEGSPHGPGAVLTVEGR